MLRKIIKKILYGNKYSSESYIKHLKQIGVTIGRDCTIYEPKNVTIDEQYPWMITIGNSVKITKGVIILTHDYSWSVLNKVNMNNEKGVILGASGKVIIGDNVFIGMNTIVLRGVVVGSNVIIGAGSVVSKDCEPNWVYAGNPARKVMTIESFFLKRQELQLIEARELAIRYKTRYNKIPPKDIFHEYFMIFSDKGNINNIFMDKIKLCGNELETLEYLSKNKPIFNEYQHFLEYCFKEN